MKRYLDMGGPIGIKKKLKKSGRKEKNELAHFEECLTVPDILVSFGFNLLCFELNTKIQ